MEFKPLIDNFSKSIHLPTYQEAFDFFANDSRYEYLQSYEQRRFMDIIHNVRDHVTLFCRHETIWRKFHYDQEAGIMIQHAKERAKKKTTKFKDPDYPEDYYTKWSDGAKQIWDDLVALKNQGKSWEYLKDLFFQAAQEKETEEKPMEKKKSIYIRPDKESYYLSIAAAVCSRSTCIRRQYGAVIVKDDEIIATGYNGSPRGEENCCDCGECWREANGIPHGEQYEKCVAVHAEQNAIISASRRDIIGATLYLFGREMSATMGELFPTSIISNAEPCKICWKMIKNAGISRVVNDDGVIWEREESGKKGEKKEMEALIKG